MHIRESRGISARFSVIHYPSSQALETSSRALKPWHHIEGESFVSFTFSSKLQIPSNVVASYRYAQSPKNGRREIILYDVA